MNLALLPRLDEVRAERARRSFHYFFQHFAWPVLQPATEFKDNWHINVLTEHLEAVAAGQIKRLLINMPFRMLKSSIVSQAFMAWEWIHRPDLQYLTASYARDIAVRDAVNSRRIIESDAYQAAFGDRFQMAGDQNVKSRMDNNKSGTRVCTSTEGAATGFGGNRIIIDDPISAKEADSLVAIASSIEFYKGTVATRLNNPESDAIVVVHQRLNANDLTGYLLASEAGWEHLVLPFRYDSTLSKTTRLGFVDPRTVEGELIHPERIGEDTAKDLEKSLGSYHVQAQMQQNPEPRGGIIFARSKWQFWKVLPKLDEIILSVDATFKDLASSDYVAIQVWGSVGGNYYLLHRVKEHLGFSATCQAIRTVKAKYPSAAATLIEDRANGSAIIETLSGEIGGIIAINPEGGKVSRAYAMQPTQEAGNVWLPDPSVCPDIETFLSEVSAFPGVAHDDETDSMTQAVNWLRVRTNTMGLVHWMRAEIDERDKRRTA